MGATIFRPGQRLVIPGVQVFQPRPSAGGAFTGILDGISNVAAAYSLRQLRTAYSGSAVRVRRSSDSTEQDIGFVAGEFDSSAFSSFIGGGAGYVKTWYDQGGNAIDATQTTTANQPEIALSVVNGKPVLRFDGSNDGMAFAATTIKTAIVVAVKDAVSGAHVLLANSANANSYLTTPSSATSGANTGRAGVPMGAAANSPSGTTTAWQIVSATDAVKIFRDGAAGITQVNSDAWIFDRISSYAGLMYDGDMAEIILLSAISTADHNTIGADMATRFGLTWTTVT